ncbi:MAG: bifunctional folylpolyglutamate synthase/dihydrofolate synthase, partial [Prevotella sp.]|nr:bifunctional folylpolyglutamate synthase/dihydrofolate synthase [Prevotella sp.]
MTYKETTDYLFNQMPMFERQGASGYKEGLENTLALDTHFGHPHRSYHTIHIGGTNGKGSCSHTISAILQCCGYKVGLYTSPHILDFRERIRINGQPISEEYVVEFVKHERTFFEKMSPSFFEVTTAMALKYFKDMQVDIAVIEVGLGGNLDCTNIISPLVSVITNISYDHTQFLGDTLEKIAAEKAGIIKRGVPVVIGEATEETRHVFEKKARECNTRIVFAEDNPFILEVETTEEGLIYTTRNMGKMVGDLKGIYQEKNANTILAAMNELAKLGYVAEFADNESAAKNTKEIKQAFKCVAELTGLMGRWQKIKDVPLVVCDTGHNPAGWKYISKQLATVKCNQMHIVFG